MKMSMMPEWYYCSSCKMFWKIPPSTDSICPKCNKDMEEDTEMLKKQIKEILKTDIVSNMIMSIILDAKEKEEGDRE